MQNIESILKEFGLEIPAEQAAAFQAKFRDNYKTVKEVEKIEAARGYSLGRCSGDFSHHPCFGFCHIADSLSCRRRQNPDRRS